MLPMVTAISQQQRLEQSSFRPHSAFGPPYKPSSGSSLSRSSLSPHLDEAGDQMDGRDRDGHSPAESGSDASSSPTPTTPSPDLSDKRQGPTHTPVHHQPDLNAPESRLGMGLGRGLDGRPSAVRDLQSFMIRSAPSTGLVPRFHPYATNNPSTRPNIQPQQPDHNGTFISLSI